MKRRKTMWERRGTGEKKERKNRDRSKEIREVQ